MTSVQFFHGAPDRLMAAATWLRKTYDAGRKVIVYVPDRETADRFDRLLWTQPATDFLPHCGAASSLAGETPILLAAQLDGFAPESRLLNLSNEVPPGFEGFDELAEIVSVDDAVRLPARDRFRHYRDQGHAPASADFSTLQ